MKKYAIYNQKLDKYFDTMEGKSYPSSWDVRTDTDKAYLHRICKYNALYFKGYKIVEVND